MLITQALYTLTLVYSVVGPYMFYEHGECRGSLPNSLIEHTVDEEVVCGGRPQVHKLINDLYFVAVDEERWYFLNVLSHYFLSG